MDIKVLLALEVGIAFVTFVTDQQVIGIDMRPGPIGSGPAVTMTRTLGKWTVVPSFSDNE